MKLFEHIHVKTIEEALSALSRYRGKARINAGGTDLLGMLKDRILPDYPEAIIDIKGVSALSHIREDGAGVRIGALTRLCDIAGSPLLKKRFAVLAEASRGIAGPQIRNAATLGGNLCQDVRCWYYRYPRHIGGTVTCARKGSGPCFAVKGENRYHAVLGGKKCFAVCPSDTAVALAALDAQIVIAGPEGERKLSVLDFYHPMGNGLRRDEMVKEVEVPGTSCPAQQRFLKFTLRKPIDFAIVSVAAAIHVRDGICADARIVLGAVAPGPVRADAAEKAIIGGPISEKKAEEAGELALQGARPLSQNAYKIEIAKILVKRAIAAGNGDEMRLFPATRLDRATDCGLI